MGIKYSVNEDFFKTWNPTMAYVLGFIYADGCIYQSVRGSYLSITSTDSHIITNIKRWMQSEHSITETIFCNNRKPKFGLRIGNKEIYSDLLKLGVYPSKSLAVRMPDVPTFLLRHFVRGCFDGDGCVNLYRSKGSANQIILRKLTTIFTSGSKLFLYDLLESLKVKMELTQTKVYSGRRAFQIRFNTSESIQFFKFMYAEVPVELFFLRKFKIYETYFSLRPQRIDKEVEIILRYVGHGHVVKQ